MRIPVIKILFFLFLILSLVPLCHSREVPVQTEDWTLSQIQVAPSGLLQRSGRDPYIVFPPLEETNYNITGVMMEIVFTPMVDKPFLMELFWRPDYEGFSEHRKVFFVLLPEKDGDTIKFFVPLNKKEGYKQFRLDFPRDINSSFQVKRFEPVSGQVTSENVKQVEPFYRLTVTETRKPEIIIPYILHGIKHGLSRMLYDPAFLTVWLVILFGVLVATRRVKRSLQQQEGKGDANEPDDDIRS